MGWGYDRDPDRRGQAVERATNRRPFIERTIPTHHRIALMRAAEADDVVLILLDTPREVGALAKSLRRADHLQEQDPAFQVELLAWTTGAAHRANGAPRVVVGPSPIGGSLLTLRHYGHETSAMGRPLSRTR